MVKKTNLKPAVLAFVITLVIFLIGGLMGYVAGAEKSKILTGETVELKNDLQNLQLEMFYIDVMGENSSCSIMEAETASIDRKLNDLGLRLQALEDSREFSEEFYLLKDEYMFLQIRSWLFYREFSKRCDKNSVDMIYFFSSGQCASCSGQASILNPLNEELGGNLVLFSLDIDWEQPIMQALKKDFNVTEVPALVINGKKHGFLERQQILDIVCEEYGEKPPACIQN